VVVLLVVVLLELLSPTADEMATDDGYSPRAIGFRRAGRAERGSGVVEK
jgi:hypothetical protein